MKKSMHIGQLVALIVTIMTLQGCENTLFNDSYYQTPSSNYNSSGYYDSYSSSGNNNHSSSTDASNRQRAQIKPAQEVQPLNSPGAPKYIGSNKDQAPQKADNTRSKKASVPLPNLPKDL